MVDFVIALAIVAGAVAGWRKGVIVPLVTQAGAVLGIAALYGGPFSGNVPSGAVGLLAGFGALFVAGWLLGSVGSFLTGVLHRFGAVRRVDQVLGVPLGAATAAVTIYVALVGAVALDGWLAPLHGAAVLTQKDVQALQAIVAQNPAAGAFADPASLQALALASARAPVNPGDLAKYDAVLAAYENTVRPQLLASRFAPLILAAGEPLPFIGRHVDFPAK